MDDPFADIRPYRDEEVAAVLARLLTDREFLDTMASFRLGRLAALAPALVRPLVRRALLREVRGVADVSAMQVIIKRYMDRMIEDTTGGFSVSGLERSGPGAPLSLYEQSPGHRHGPGVYQLRPAPGQPRDGANCHRRQPADQALGVRPDAAEQELYRQAFGQRPPGITGGIEEPRQLYPALTAAGAGPGMDRPARGARQGRDRSHRAGGDQDDCQ